MMGKKNSAALLVAIFALAACAEEPEVANRPAPTPTTSRDDSQISQEQGHAPAGVVPGSYEDWCDEHQVPESVCTRCDPSLIAAFQATNDWCAEHGLPESQCLKCNPNLEIVRPPKPEGT